MLRRLRFWSGLVPLGAFLLIHLILNERALAGPAAFENAVFHARVPARCVLDALLVLTPLVVHAALGLWVVFARKSGVSPSPYSASIRTAMRVTGVLAGGFIAMHLTEVRLRLAGAHLGGGEIATILSEDLSSTSHGIPVAALAYLGGTGCVVFHFAVGLWGAFATSRAGRASLRARQWLAYCAMALGLSVWTGYADVVVFHATGARLVGFGAHAEAARNAPCPPSDP